MKTGTRRENVVENIRFERFMGFVVKIQPKICARVRMGNMFLVYSLCAREGKSGWQLTKGKMDRDLKTFLRL